MTLGVWQHSAHIAFVCSENRVVAVDLTRSPDAPQILSASASAVWQAIDGERTDDAIVAAVAHEYDMSPDAIAADVETFLAQLANSGLIVRTPIGDEPR